MRKIGLLIGASLLAACSETPEQAFVRDYTQGLRLTDKNGCVFYSHQWISDITYDMTTRFAPVESNESCPLLKYIRQNSLEQS
jgi:hypothetical protein